MIGYGEVENSQTPFLVFSGFDGGFWHYPDS